MMKVIGYGQNNYQRVQVKGLQSFVAQLATYGGGDNWGPKHWEQQEEILSSPDLGECVAAAEEYAAKYGFTNQTPPRI